MVTHSPYLLDTLELDRHSLRLRCADCQTDLSAWSASETRSRESILNTLTRHRTVCAGRPDCTPERCVCIARGMLKSCTLEVSA